MGLNLNITQLTDEDIRQFIRTKRKQHKLTQNQVADFIGVHRKTYSNYEIGSSYISTVSFIKLLSLYGYKLEIFEK